jgi:hypothetical protein
MTTEIDTPAAAQPLTIDDLTNFLMAHAGMRAEFGRLAEATRVVRDEPHADLLESQLALVLHVLHHHHTVEDELVWPPLVARVPEHAQLLQDLEDQHIHIDPLIQAAGDVRVPLAQRADTLQALHEALNSHLDQEERDALPLIVSYLTRAEWERVEEVAGGNIGRKRLPLIYGWLTSAAPEDLRLRATAGVPLPVQWLFRLFWWPSYRHRYERLYGDASALPNV